MNNPGAQTIRSPETARRLGIVRLKPPDLLPLKVQLHGFSQKLEGTSEAPPPH